MFLSMALFKQNAVSGFWGRNVYPSFAYGWFCRMDGVMTLLAVMSSGWDVTWTCQFGLMMSHANAVTCGFGRSARNKKKMRSRCRFSAMPACLALAQSYRPVLRKRLQTRKAICCPLHGILAHMGVMLAHLLAVVAYHFHDHGR